jgi:hypothetical protein
MARKGNFLDFRTIRERNPQTSKIAARLGKRGNRMKLFIEINLSADDIKIHSRG